MSTADHLEPLSVQDYLRGEQTARHKHEYVEGVVYAMVGATNVHNRIATNGTGRLHEQLRGKPFQVFNSNTKVRVRRATGTRFYYPDVSIVCRLNPPDDTFQDSPAVIMEVLSESTRRIDEHEKREAYLSIDSLAVYLTVETSVAAVVAYRRTDSGFRREGYAGLDVIVPLPEVECELALSELYEHVELPPPPADAELDGRP